MSLKACGSIVSMSWPTPMLSLAVLFGVARGARARADAVSASSPETLAAESPKTAARPTKLRRLIVLSRYSSTRSASVARSCSVSGSPTLSLTTSMGGLALFMCPSLLAYAGLVSDDAPARAASAPSLRLARNLLGVDIDAAGRDQSVPQLVDLRELEL